MNSPLNLHPKVAGGSLSGALSLIALWLLSYWITVPPVPAAALTLVFSFVGSWLAPAFANGPPTIFHGDGKADVRK